MMNAEKNMSHFHQFKGLKSIKKSQLKTNVSLTIMFTNGLPKICQLLHDWQV